MQGAPAPSPVAGLVSVLEADFRQLSHDARKSEGFASFFNNSDNQPEVKEAAERAVMKIRALADHPNAMDQIRTSKASISIQANFLKNPLFCDIIEEFTHRVLTCFSPCFPLKSLQELLKPLQLSCDTKSARLISQSLATVQKMVSNEALSPEGADSVIEMLAKVEKMGDEGVQLKVLQTALTLLQSPLHPTTEDGIATILGLCFRSLTQKGRKDTVTSTAAATVRQSVAIVFTYVNVGEEIARLQRLKMAAEDSNAVAAAAAAKATADAFPSLALPPSLDDLPSQELSAAQKLLEDLIAIATGAPPTWLKTPSLPRTFILEVLDFALANSSELFMSLPDFQSALSLRISQLLQAQLQDYLDAGAAGAQLAAANFPAFKATLRCVRTLLVRYHTQLGIRCGMLIQTVLKGLGPGQPATQRIATGQLVKQILEDAPLIYYLFITFDMQRDRKLDAVRALVGAVADTVDSALKNQGASETSGGNGGGGSGSTLEEANADAIGALFQSRSQSKDWSVDTDYETATPTAQHAYLAMLSLDSLLHFMASVEVLTYAASEGGGELQGSDWYALSTRERLLLGTPREVPSSAPPPLPIEYNACAALVDTTWRATLSVLSQMLALSTRESMVLSLLKGYQGFTQACGVLELAEPRDAFLGALCQLALSADGERPSISGGGGGRASGSYSRSSSPRLERAGSGGGNYSPRSPSSSSGAAGQGGGLVGSPTSSNQHHRTTSVENYDSGIVLTPKNVQAMRTLFNIAHRLANVLGPGWALVLETLNTLDRVLHSPKTTTQDGEGGGGAGGGNGNGPLLSSDLAILSAAASQLFECTRDMSREAVVALLSGLRDVSIAHMPHAAQVSQPRMFALERMVEVLLFNIHRIYDLWGIFLSHVLEIVDDPKPLVRSAAIDALGQAIVGALGGLSASGASENSTDNINTSSASAVPSIANTPITMNESTGGLEHMLLVALEALHNDERERDVRVGVLRVLLAVLQRHGERLTDGWTPVFRLLAVVPGQEDPETVSLGFQSLQLAATDYMPAMPFSRLKRCLEVAVAYGEQQTDLNVSLTTISLLWNVGDMLSRTRLSGDGNGGGARGAFSRKGESGGGSASRHRRNLSTVSATSVGKEDEDVDINAKSSPRGSGGGGVTSGVHRPNQLVAVTTPAQIEELLELIFSALQSLSQDPRPEVRNSGARTLFAVVITQGPRLSRVVWERCLWELLFPLLRHAFHMSATSSKEEAQAALLGRSKGTQVRLVMHHSRNTEQKQWDETVVVAVGGMARLLRAHLPAIAAMEGMEAGWDELMIVAESSLAGGRKEVAVAAVGLLGGVLGAHGGDDTVVTPAMWRRSMRALDVGVEAATSAGCLVPLSARTELVQLVGALYTQLRPRFTENDTIYVFRWVEAFCRNPWSEDDATNVVQTVGMPPVQKAALALLPTLGPDHLPELWPRYVLSIVKLVQPAHVVAAWQEHHEAELAAAAAAAEEMHNGGGSEEVRRNDSTAGPVTPARPSGGISSLSTGLGATPGPLGTGGISSSVQLGASKQSQHKFALNSAFLEKVTALLVQVYDAAPTWVRAVTFAKVVEALGHCMELRFIVYQEKLWRSAATTFNQLVPIGVAAIGLQLPATIAADPDFVNAVTQSWSALAAVYENFLLGEKFQRQQMGVEAPKIPIAAIHRRGSSTSSEQHGTASGTGTGTGGDLPLLPVLDVPKKGATTNKKEQTPAVTTTGSGLRRGFGKKAAATGTTSTTATVIPGDSTNNTATAPSAPLVDAAQGRADVDLELSVLDSLTDDALTKCGPAPLALKRRLIAVVDRGIARPRELSIPQATTGSNFSHVCVRKMYVLCSRVSGDSDDGLLLVARLALPLFLSRCDTMLRNFAEEARPGFLGDGPPVTRPRLDEIMCVLEVIASMAVAPSVVDAVLGANEPISAVINALRARPEVAARGRERTHLLLLYNSLCGCVTCKEPRVREMVRDVLGLAGAELGLGM